MTSSSTSTLILIGWDDRLGRPIYSRNPQAIPSSAPPAKKKSKVPIKKGTVISAERKKNKVKTKRPRGHHSNNGYIGRRNIPTVQVAVGSLMAVGTTDYNNNDGNDNDELLYKKKINQQQSSSRAASKLVARKVSFSPTSKAYNHHDTVSKKHRDFNSSKPIAKKSWDNHNKKRRGYGSKKFARGSGYYYNNISPSIFVLEGGTEWGGTSPSGDNDCDDTLAQDFPQEDEVDEEVLSGDNDDDLSSTRSNNDDDVDLSFSAAPLETVPRDIQSAAYESIHSSLDNHSESKENDGSGSFSYEDLDNPDEFDRSQSSSIHQQNDCVPDMIHVDTNVAITNGDDLDGDDDDDDLTANAEEPGSTFAHSVNGHHTPSTKTAAEETSYQLHSVGTHDFIDYDVPLDEAVAADENVIRGKKRSYGCSEKPVWASNKRGKASAATAITSGNAVGWDEVKCRPIFHTKSKKKVDENDLGANSCDVDDDVASDDESNANIKSHKRRQYSSRFRKTSLTKAIEQMSVLASPEVADDHLECVESSQGQEDCSGDDFNVDDDANDDEEDEKSNVGLDSEMEEVPINENVCRIQPTESSSLEAARAFFRYLDSSHRLVVDQGDASPRISSEVIRTTRRIVHSDQLRTEYSEYCDMLAQTGVAPISITEFANNWNRYFVGKGIRDGLFDED